MTTYYRTPQQAAVYARHKWEQRRGLRDRVVRHAKTPLTLTEPEKAYLAAAIDFDGCIRLRAERIKMPSPTVIITNTNVLAKEWILARVPFGTWKTSRHTLESTIWKPCHFVTWYSANAVAILEAVFPYLVLKKANAEIVLGLWNAEEKYLKEHDMCRFSKHLPVPEHIKCQRVESLTKIAELNRRGRSQ